MILYFYFKIYLFAVEKLFEAGDKFIEEARDILRPDTDPAPPPTFCDRYGLRGRKVVGIVGVIVLVAILTVFGKN